jgi:thioredoxin reductase
MRREDDDDQERRPGIRDRLRGAVRGTTERVTGAADTITGVQFRKQFEDFTDAVTTAVVGVHRDQADLRERLAKLETASTRSGASGLIIAVGVIAGLALVLSIVAVVRTF